MGLSLAHIYQNDFHMSDIHFEYSTEFFPYTHTAGVSIMIDGQKLNIMVPLTVNYTPRQEKFGSMLKS